MDTGESDGEMFDDEIDDTRHERIVENVLKLNKAQHLKKPSRTEPTLQISEFNLVKSAAGKGSTVALDSLTKALKKRKKLSETVKKIESTGKKARTLPKPLEKPQSARIKRSVGYEKSRLQFDRWEGFVASNRALAHQVYPLGSLEKTRIEEREAANFPQTWRIKSEIQRELEKLEPRVEINRVDEDQKEFTLTLEELKERRNEMAKLRAHQSYKESKARRQNKIKSKKYHRLLRRETIRKKLKEFEELQKTNPEEALNKLEEIERARALERYSLRHKGTGRWAKSKQFRAKYDKQSRQVLAQQLAISRDLTQKSKGDGDSDEEIAEDDNNLPESYKDNPWIGTPKPDKEVAEFYSSYKKYWSGKVGEGAADPASGRVEGPSVGSEPRESKKKKPPKVEKTQKSMNSSSGEWDIEELFQRAENALGRKLQNKMKSMKKKTKLTVPKPAKRAKSKSKGAKIDLSMPTQSKRHAIDEEMLEMAGESREIRTQGVDGLKKVLEGAIGDEKGVDIVVPDNLPKARAATVLDSANPDLVEEDGNRQDANQDRVIVEAFEDDDIDADFGKEKAEEIDKDKPKDIDLNLPGWGSWAGAMIDPKKQRKRKRFIFKMPEKMPRRDENRGSLIINEKAEEKIRSHLVSEVPFPFKTVKDFEASIRAPIGNTFVPETAFRKLVRPAVETKMGAIITPVTKDLLTGKKRKK
ncbi:U3 small nucleolar RNA-associated protein 14 homolog A [Cylas formicarius]|uniref:U3 small nucleolar RNA-associated protein 14 homolog A n=1 Tax=Cylas formicarius TaxID=197179 RepID=UPI002958B802|nr:U3 small nucleolar RNA-associated protein 14 homolog A [Cylas formicarius]